LNQELSFNEHQSYCKKLFEDINIRSDKFKDIHGAEYDSLTNELEKYDKEISSISSLLIEK